MAPSVYILLQRDTESTVTITSVFLDLQDANAALLHLAQEAGVDPATAKPASGTSSSDAKGSLSKEPLRWEAADGTSAWVERHTVTNRKQHAHATNHRHFYSFALGAVIMVSATILLWILPVAVLGITSVKALLNPCLELLSRELLAVLENNSYTNVLAVDLVGNGKADSLADARMAGQDVVQLNRADLLAALVDKLLDAARDDDVAVLVLLTLVASSEEAVLVVRGSVGLGVVEVALGDVLTNDADFTLRALGNLLTLLGKNLNLDALTNTYGASLSLGRRKRVGRHLMRSLGHGIGLENGGAVCLLELLEDGFLSRIWWIVGTAVYQLALHNHGTAGEERSEKTTEKAVDMEQRHDQHGSVLGGEFICVLDVVCDEVSDDYERIANAIRDQPCVKNESNIIRLSCKNLLLLALEKSIVLDIEGNLTLCGIPVALSDRGVELLSGLHAGSTSVPSALRNKDDSALDILDVELKLVLLVSWVERRSDSALPGSGEE
ncbi:hypothetical protein HG530_007597 [Fusarium avenaceum]|nr:hypothetical protein HG530_007597 [Fusarium avenaceum]